jgi:hypothetical protein
MVGYQHRGLETVLCQPDVICSDELSGIATDALLTH